MKTNNHTQQQKLAIWISTVFGLGYLPKAPGTWGSIPGVFLAAGLFNIMEQYHGGGDGTSYWLSLSSSFWMIGILSVLSVLSVWSIGITERSWSTHDDKRIVIDEVIGQMVALSFFRPTVMTLGLGFILFRLFDIWKPGPIGWIDKNVHGPWGTLLDDVLAGVMAAIVLWIISLSLF